MSEGERESRQKGGLPGFPRDFGWLSLRRKTGQEARRTINRPEYRIGREIGNELTLPDPVISRYHARIRCSPEGCQLEDLGSANGTYLNEVRIPPNEPQPLIEGDVIRIGDYSMTYHPPEPVDLMDDDEFVLTFAEVPPSPELPELPLAWPIPPRSSYLRYLPSFFSKDGLMDRYLLIFESILAPIEQLVDHVPLLLDPRTTPADLLPWVASWLDLTLNENWPEERRRDLIRAASELYRWRGTRQGLSRYLETYAGVTPEINDVLEQAHTFRVTLRIPAGQVLDDYLVRAIIEAEKPAHTAYQLEIITEEPPKPEPKKPEPKKPAPKPEPEPKARAKAEAGKSEPEPEEKAEPKPEAAKPKKPKPEPPAAAAPAEPKPEPPPEPPAGDPAQPPTDQ